MKRDSVYPRASKGRPGDTIFYLRNAMGLSQRDLAKRCIPPLDHTTIRKIENGEGYTKNTLGIIAIALNVKIEELFYPPEVADIMTLDCAQQEQVMNIIQSVMALYRSK